MLFQAQMCADYVPQSQNLLRAQATRQSTICDDVESSIISSSLRTSSAGLFGKIFPLILASAVSLGALTRVYFLPNKPGSTTPITVSAPVPAPATVPHPAAGYAVHAQIRSIMRDIISEKIAASVAIKHRLNQEQIANYEDEYRRLTRMIDIVFGNSISRDQKRLWRLLLLGTAVTETNFLDRYSGRSKNGNGRYQIIGDTARGIIHSYISYPLKEGGRGYRNNLTELFERITSDRPLKDRLTWNRVYAMNKYELRDLCVNDKDFSTLMAILVYQDEFRRKLKTMEISVPEGKQLGEVLGRLWKEHYNSNIGVGTVARYVSRFRKIYSGKPSEIMANFHNEVVNMHAGLYAGALPDKIDWHEFLRITNYLDNISNLTLSLLRDTYGITQDSIDSKMSQYKILGGHDNLWYCQFKEDSRMHAVLAGGQEGFAVILVACDDISEWVKTGEARARINITDRPFHSAMVERLKRQYPQAADKPSSAGIESKGLSQAIEAEKRIDIVILGAA
jgi:hypothetical protein